MLKRNHIFKFDAEDTERVIRNSEQQEDNSCQYRNLECENKLEEREYIKINKKIIRNRHALLLYWLSITALLCLLCFYSFGTDVGLFSWTDTVLHFIAFVALSALGVKFENNQNNDLCDKIIYFLTCLFAVIEFGLFTASIFVDNSNVWYFSIGVPSVVTSFLITSVSSALNLKSWKEITKILLIILAGVLCIGGIIYSLIMWNVKY